MTQMWAVYLKDENGDLHYWAKCDDERTARGIAEDAMAEYEAVKGYAITQVI